MKSGVLRKNEFFVLVCLVWITIYTSEEVLIPNILFAFEEKTKFISPLIFRSVLNSSHIDP